MNKTNLKGWLAMSIICVALTQATTIARIIYVDDDANGLNDGSSWKNAYKFLQDALADANSNGDVNEIRVAQGIYKTDVDSNNPNGTGDPNASFNLINNLIIKGGFAGFGADNPNVSDSKKYETILSGETHSGHSYHVVVANGDVTNTGILDGFTITGGRAVVDTYEIVDGEYLKGGGIYIYRGSPTIINCLIKDNMQSWEYGFASTFGGGGMYVAAGNPILRNCIFKQNTASSGGGGGIHIFGGSSNIIIINCTFEQNQGAGGGIFINVGSATLQNCIFTKNSGSYGAAVCVMNWGEAYFINCTFNGNDGDVVYSWCYSGNLILNNCILFNNTAPQIHIGTNYAPVTLSINYSDVQDGESGIVVDDGAPAIINWNNGNIDTDPLFADPNNGDYHLKSEAGRWNPTKQRWVYDEVTSPCIDAGDPNSSVGLEPNPNGGRINMGAYGGTSEASKSYCANPIDGDINGDCKVDFKDFAIMASHWLEGATP